MQTRGREPAIFWSQDTGSVMITPDRCDPELNSRSVATVLRVNFLMTQLWAFFFFFRCLYYQFCSCWGRCFSVVTWRPASPAPPLRCWKWLHVSHTNWHISSLQQSVTQHIYSIYFMFTVLIMQLNILWLLCIQHMCFWNLNSLR